MPSPKTTLKDLKTCCPEKSGQDSTCQRVRLSNKRGLHARAANKFSALTQSFDAAVTVTSYNDICCETVVGDSIMELLLLGSACDEEILICATGSEADQAVSALVKLVEDKFGEGE